MKILLIGKNGQVGWELQRSLSILGEVIAISSKDTKLCGDLANLTEIAETIRMINPDIVVNAAAYTAVDRAEAEHGLAYLLNAESVAVLAKETAQIGALLVHYSTDYVFDGSGQHCRTEDDTTNPLNIYGKSKLEGELVIAKYNPRHFIFRTSWVYASRGHNFIKTMLHLAHTKKILNIINDQYGAPTGAELIADATAMAIRHEINNHSNYGTYHLVAGGETTWFDYANYIFKIAKENKEQLMLEEVCGIATDSYPTPATRPHNSRLENTKFQNTFNVFLPNWKCGVKRSIVEILENKKL